MQIKGQSELSDKLIIMERNVKNRWICNGMLCATKSVAYVETGFFLGLDSSPAGQIVNEAEQKHGSEKNGQGPTDEEAEEDEDIDEDLDQESIGEGLIVDLSPARRRP